MYFFCMLTVTKSKEPQVYHAEVLYTTLVVRNFLIVIYCGVIAPFVSCSLQAAFSNKDITPW